VILPNGLAFSDRGTIYVTESFSLAATGYGQGGIWRIPPNGEAEVWLRDPVLTGIGLFGNPPMGANGIAYYHFPGAFGSRAGYYRATFPIPLDGARPQPYLVVGSPLNPATRR
jgi:hypothetical protein